MNGKRVLFRTGRLGPTAPGQQLFSASADGTFAAAENLTTELKGPASPELSALKSGTGSPFPCDTAPNGDLVLSMNTTHQQVFTLRFEPVAQVIPWLQTNFDERCGRLSPNGRWLAYQSNASGTYEIWLRSYPEPGTPVRVSPAGGRDPVWSRDGKELFYQVGRRMMAAAIVEHEATLRAAPPRVLFEGGLVPGTAEQPSSYDVSLDGRFVVVEPTSRDTQASLVLALNWLEEVKANMRTGANTK